MSKGSATASAFALALTCAGCGSWSGFGFDAAAPNAPCRLALKGCLDGAASQLTGAREGSGVERARLLDRNRPGASGRLREAASRTGMGQIVSWRW